MLALDSPHTSLSLRASGKKDEDGMRQESGQFRQLSTERDNRKGRNFNIIQNVSEHHTRGHLSEQSTIKHTTCGTQASNREDWRATRVCFSGQPASAIGSDTYST